MNYMQNARFDAFVLLYRVACKHAIIGKFQIQKKSSILF